MSSQDQKQPASPADWDNAKSAAPSDAKKPDVDWRDACGAIGLCLIGAGVWLVYVPAALIVVGALMLALAVLSARIR